MTSVDSTKVVAALPMKIVIADPTVIVSEGLKTVGVVEGQRAADR